MVYLGAAWEPAAHHGQVALAHGMVFKGLRQRARRRRVQAHHQHAAGALVEPVHGVDMLAQLVAQRLHYKTGLPGIQSGAVHQPACRFVHRHHIVIAPENVQQRHQCACAASLARIFAAM